MWAHLQQQHHAAVQPDGLDRGCVEHLEARDQPARRALGQLRAPVGDQRLAPGLIRVAHTYDTWGMNPYSRIPVAQPQEYESLKARDQPARRALGQLRVPGLGLTPRAPEKRYRRG